jgi:uncharacterized membrane protein
MIFSWLHILALAVYLGCLIALYLLLVPGLPTLGNEKQRIELLSRVLRIYNPVQIGSLGLLVLTGAYRITDLKAVHRDLFHQFSGATLEIKLALAFIIIILSTYQCMGVAHPFVRESEAEEDLGSDRLQSVTHRLRLSTVILFFLTLIAVFVGTKMRHW